MRSRIFITSLGVLFSLLLRAQPVSEKNAIRNLCGCFEVTFKYAETFASDTAYQYPKSYYAKGLEWVVAEEVANGKLVLQHLLVVADTMIVKHWREDWEYEKESWWAFDKEAVWNKRVITPAAAKGTWTQTVWEVDDAPRYQGSSKWMHNNAMYYWEHTTDAPLPRREYTKRNDYNVMQRRNRIVVDDKGWVHEQDNKKLLRITGAPDLLIAEEKGYNVYTRTNVARCKVANDWWASHRVFWHQVRDAWDELLTKKQVVKLHARVGAERLDRSLAQIEVSGLRGETRMEAIRRVLTKFVE